MITGRFVAGLGLALLSAPLPAAAPAAGKVFPVVIAGMKFGPVPAGLRPGDTILWVNKDMFRHSATAADHSFDVDLPPGQSGKALIRHAGAIAFSCKYHPAMKGVLAVQPRR